MKNMHALAIWLQLLLAWIPFVYLFVVDFRLGKAMAKRLRGWQLEQESGRKAIKGNKALEKATALEKADGLEKHESPLASKLLHLWASGSLSAVMVRELANLALQDGADHPELVKLAQCGNWGAQPGNCHRQILNKFCSDVMLPEPFSIKVKCIDPKTSLEKVELASVYLPHLQFAHLGEHYPEFFKETFHLGKGDLEKFWKGVQTTKDDRLEGHPMCLEKHWQLHSIPIFVYGDGVEYQTRDTMLVWSWGCFLGDMASMKQHQLLAAFPKSCTAKDTWPTIWKYLKWSFEALGKGFHPTHDPDGRPLEKGSKLLGKAGQPLHPKGYKAHIWAVQGDHEFFSNHLKLPHWASKYPCWECNAENFEGCKATLNVKELDLDKSKFKLFSQKEQLGKASHLEHPLFQVPGVTAKTCRGDPMHISFCKGLYGHVIGSILHYLCWYEGPGKVCKERPSKRIGVIFDEIQQEYKSQGLEHRLTNLKLSMFTNAEKPWLGKATMDCKAGESKHLLPALVPVLEKMFAGTKKEEKKMLSAAKSLEKLVALWDEAGTFLTPAEFSKGMALGKEFLLAYKWLNAWSLEKGRHSFAIVVKHHTFIHLLWNSKFLNPKRHWNFKGEDFVGRISRMAHSISFGVSSTRVSSKLCIKYRLFYHFLLTRSMEEPVWDSEED